MINITLNNMAITPSKVVCVGRNYVAHIEELNNEIPSEPVIFLKPNSAILPSVFNGDTATTSQNSDNDKKARQHETYTAIQVPAEPDADEIHYEAELSFVLTSGKLSGVGIGLDLTKRGLQSKLKAKRLPWERAKAFDGSATFSAFVSTPQNIDGLRLQLFRNGQLQQDGGCALMIYQPLALVAEIQTFMSIEDGDIVMTGTPSGVGPLKIGDEFVGQVYDGDMLLVEHVWKIERKGNKCELR